MIQLDDGRQAEFLSESGALEPTDLTAVDDTTRAADAYRMIMSGKVLLWTGDYVNGRQLLSALARRSTKARPVSRQGTPWGIWKDERAATRARGELLGNVVVLVEATGQLGLRRAPDTTSAVALAWGQSQGPRVVALNTLVGALSAAQWTARGVDVPGLDGQITPRFGVFSPTRRAYVDLLEHIDPSGRSVLDVGCGTGVLGFVLLQRGGASAIGTDVEARAVACAKENAEQLGLAGRYRAVAADMFDGIPKDERFDIVLFNAPWVPETPRTALDRAVFDEDGEVLRRFLRGAPERLKVGGIAALVISDLPEQLGLRDEGELEALMSASGLRVRASYSVPASHKRAKDTGDRLHQIRSSERIQLFVLEPADPS